MAAAEPQQPLQLQPVTAGPTDFAGSFERFMEQELAHPQTVVARAGVGLKFTLHTRTGDHEIELPVLGRVAGRSDSGYGDSSTSTWVVVHIDPFVSGHNKGKPHYAFLKQVTAFSDTHVQYSNPPYSCGVAIQPVCQRGEALWQEDSRASAFWRWDEVLPKSAGIDK